jgi:Protein of unknown function (DUF2637)
MTTQAEVTQRNHRRAVRFFWSFLIGATMVSLIGNVVHAVWHLIPSVFIQIGTAAVPPLFLLAVVHGIALSVRAGASGTVYRCAVAATAVIGAGAFVLSFRALRDLLTQMGTPPAWAWLFPAVVDTAVGVSTMMLVALGDRPVRRAARVGTQIAPLQKAAQTPSQPAKPKVNQAAPAAARTPGNHAVRQPVSASAQPNQAHASWSSAQTEVSPEDAEASQVDADLASDLIASGVTTQSTGTVIAVLAACRNGASINAAAKASGINYRTAQRIVQAANAASRPRDLAPTG